MSRGVEICVEIGVEQNEHRQMHMSKRCQGTKHQTQEKGLDRSTKCQKAIEETGDFLIDPLGVEELARLQ